VLHNNFSILLVLYLASSARIENKILDNAKVIAYIKDLSKDIYLRLRKTTDWRNLCFFTHETKWLLTLNRKKYNRI